MSTNLQAQEIWDKEYEDFDFFIAAQDDAVSKFLFENIPRQPGNCFEVGCFPGRYMALLGQKGWILNGIDLTPHLFKMVDWFNDNKWNVGKFEIVKFEEYPQSKKYELVYSLGFIEHFTNFEEIIAMHTPMVKPGGKLIITTPNFTGIQGLLHWFLDSVNYNRHYVKSMNLKKWQKVLINNGFVIEKAQPFGKFAFWYDSQHRPYYKRFFLYRFIKIVPFLERHITFDSKYLSPFLGIVARKL